TMCCMAAIKRRGFAESHSITRAAAHLFAGRVLRALRFACSHARLQAAGKSHPHVSRHCESLLRGRALPDVRADPVYAVRSPAARDDPSRQSQPPHLPVRSRDLPGRKDSCRNVLTTTPTVHVRRRGVPAPPLPRTHLLPPPIAEDIRQSADPWIRNGGKASFCWYSRRRQSHRRSLSECRANKTTAGRQPESAPAAPFLRLKRLPQLRRALLLTCY